MSFNLIHRPKDSSMKKSPITVRFVMKHILAAVPKELQNDLFKSFPMDVVTAG